MLLESLDRCHIIVDRDRPIVTEMQQDILWD
jgi:hypothetical protein